MRGLTISIQTLVVRVSSRSFWQGRKRGESFSALPTSACCPMCGGKSHPAMGTVAGVSHQGDKVCEGELEGDINDLIPAQGWAQVPVVVGHEVLEQLLLLVPAAHAWGAHMPWGHPGAGTAGPPMLPGPAGMGGGARGVRGEGVSMRVLLWVCASSCACLCVSVSQCASRGGVCPIAPTLLTPGTSPGQDVGTMACQHGDTLVGRCVVLHTHG